MDASPDRRGVARGDTIQAQFDRIGLLCDGRFSQGSFRGGFDTFGRWHDARPVEDADGPVGRPSATHPGYRMNVSCGWHEFPVRDFQIDDPTTATTEIAVTS